MTKQEVETLLELISKAMTELFSYQDYTSVNVEELTQSIIEEYK